MTFKQCSTSSNRVLFIYSGRAFQADLKTGKLQAILGKTLVRPGINIGGCGTCLCGVCVDEFTLKEKLQLQSATSVEHCVSIELLPIQ